MPELGRYCNAKSKARDDVWDGAVLQVAPPLQGGATLRGQVTRGFTPGYQMSGFQPAEAVGTQG